MVLVSRSMEKLKLVEKEICEFLFVCTYAIATLDYSGPVQSCC